TVEERSAIELEIIGHLRGAEHGVFESGVVAVHEHHRLVLESNTTADAIAYQFEELLTRQGLELEQREMVFGVLGLLVDGDVGEWDADSERPLDVRDLVRLWHRHQRAPELEPASAFGAVGDALGLLRALTIGTVEDWYNVPGTFRLVSHTGGWRRCARP